jgi:hypothetical protein
MNTVNRWIVDDKKLKVEVKGQVVLPNLEEHDNQTLFMTTATFRGGIQSLWPYKIEKFQPWHIKSVAID